MRRLLGSTLLAVMLMTAAVPVIFASPQHSGKKKKGGKKGAKKGPAKGGRGGSR
jgi:hypothetical protein